MTLTSRPAAATIDWHDVPWTLPAAPRPRIELDGTWDFSPDPDGQLTLANWQNGARPADLRQIQVPIPWQAQFDDLRDYMGVAWYRRTISIPAEWQDAGVALHIGAADYYTEAWLDGQPLGAHEGGYLPFSFLLPAGKSGAAELVIKVTDPSDNRLRFPEWTFDEIPHGKQSWYGPIGGIWQSVYLELRPAHWIEQVFCTPDLPGAAVDVLIVLGSPPDNGDSLLLVLRAPDGQEIARQNVPLTAVALASVIPCARVYAEDGRLVAARVAIAQPRLWSPDDPALYALEATLTNDGATDKLEEYFGMRSIEARAGRIYLNGEPIYLFAALDQDYYPDTIYTPPSTEFLFDQFHKARELGLNMLRCHIKVADPRYYQVADRLGLLVWTEIPNWENRTLAAGRRGYETFEAMVRRDWNHASIVIWTLINEDWGIELRHNSRDREWLSRFYDDAKLYDPTRLVVDNSPCFFNFHMHTDIEDFHNYYAIPDHRDKWDRWVHALANRAYWTFEYSGDDLWEPPDYVGERGPQTAEFVTRTGEEPIVLSEFGNWGLPKVEPLYENGREPWWFETGFNWGPVYPHDVETRFKYHYLDKVFGSYAALCEKSQQQQYLALKYEIETIRCYNSICGYVITEFTDVHWECNGLLDMRRNTKLYHNEMAALNATTLLIPRTQRYSYWSGETARLTVFLSHWGRQPLDNCVLYYSAPDLGVDATLAVPAVSNSETVRLAVLELPLPEIAGPVKTRLKLELVDATGAVLAHSYEDLYVFPQAQRQDGGARIGVWNANTVLSEALVDLGYEVVPMPGGDATVSICTTLTKEIQDHVQRGGKVLALINDDDALGAQVDQIHAVARAGRAWAGDWASNFNWYRQDIAFPSLPGDGRFDLAFTNVAPDYVLTGFANRHFEAEVLAGIFVGWVHDNAALAALHRHGYGQALLTTLKLLPNLNGDPIAVRLLHDLIAHLTAAM